MSIRDDERRQIVKVDYVIGIKKKLGTGPLATNLFEGAYGTAPTGSSAKYKFHKQKRILIKTIDVRLVSDEVDLGLLQRLDHPNIANYLFIREWSDCWTSNIVIIQTYCEYHLGHLAQLLSYNWLTGQVVKSIVKGISSGLAYLHEQTPQPIVHRNLKPSNILVKPPLALPTGFVLTDFWYSNCTGPPRTGISRFFCCGPSFPEAGDPAILRWMAPELRSGEGGPATPAMDMFSFGLILEYLLSHGPLPLDGVDDYLFRLLVQELMLVKPTGRISAKDVLHRHPLLIESRERNVNDITNARMRYIKESYDRILRRDPNLERKKLRQLIDAKARSIIGDDIFPWNESQEYPTTDSFNYRIFTEMNMISQKSFDPNSLFDLLRLIRYSKKFLSVGGTGYAELIGEIKSDAFNTCYPFIIPFVYIYLDCTIEPALLSSTLFGKINRIKGIKFKNGSKKKTRKSKKKAE